MNNNGVNNLNQQSTNETNITNNTEQPTLAPMAGVKIAPAIDGPVNASNSQTASSSNASIANGNSTQPQQRSYQEFIQPQSQPQTQIQFQPQPQPQQPYIMPNSNMIRANAIDQPQIIANEEGKITTEEMPRPVEKKKSSLTPILIVLIIGLIGYMIFNQREHNAQIQNLNYNCTPITASNKEIDLDINSTLVQDLYNKVATNIREDLAEPNFNNSFKIYLAYRQVVDKDKYSSNCNLYNATSMEPYTCEETTTIKPLAIKEETLVREIKKLYGENSNIPLQNIQLGKSCIGGYQYIPQRGEFVEGTCVNNTTTIFNATKQLIEAKSTRNTITLKEEVKYHESEKTELPSYLKSGYYYYIFRLDLNYNYVLVNKYYESKY